MTTKQTISIKSMCDAYNLTQTALAKRFDIPLRTVQDWYSGRRQPPDYVLRMVDELLHIEQSSLKDARD